MIKLKFLLEAYKKNTVFPKSQVKFPVYHGSPSFEGNVFDKSKLTTDSRIFFTDSLELAQEYAHKNGNSEGVVITAWIDIQRPEFSIGDELKTAGGEVYKFRGHMTDGKIEHPMSGPNITIYKIYTPEQIKIISIKPHSI